MTTLTNTDVQRALNSARSLVKSALDLQSLHAVLEELQNNSNWIADKQAQLVALAEAQRDAQTRLDQVTALADSAQARAQEEYAGAQAAAQKMLAALDEAIAAQEARLQELTAALKVVELRVTSFRGSLLMGEAAVGEGVGLS